MQKIRTFNYLKRYRERTGFSMQDMATVIGMKCATLSRIESGTIHPGIEVLLAYHLILDVPIGKLFKDHVRKVTLSCLGKGLELEQHLLDQKAAPHIYKRLDLLNIIIDRLRELKKEHA